MQKLKFTVLTGKEAISKAIKSIQTRGKTLDMDIHKVAVACTNHTLIHRDVMPARQLIDALPKSARTNALLAWFEQYGPYTFNNETKVLDYDREKREKAQKDGLNLEEAAQNPFWEFKKEAPYKPLDLKAEIAKLLKRASARVDGQKGDVIPAETLKGLQELAA